MLHRPFPGTQITEKNESSQCVIWAFSGRVRTWASKLPSPSGKNRPATSMAQLAMKCDQVWLSLSLSHCNDLLCASSKKRFGGHVARESREDDVLSQSSGVRWYLYHFVSNISGIRICYYWLVFCGPSQQVETDTLEGVEPCLADIEAEVERLAGTAHTIIQKHPTTPIDK